MSGAVSATIVDTASIVVGNTFGEAAVGNVVAVVDESKKKTSSSASWADIAKRNLPVVQEALRTKAAPSSIPQASSESTRSVVEKQPQKNQEKKRFHNKSAANHGTKTTTAATAKKNAPKQQTEPPQPQRREQVYPSVPSPPFPLPLVTSSLAPPAPVNGNGTWYVPLYADLVRLEVCATTEINTVLYCHVPLLGDRLCDFHLVGHPSLLKRVQCVRLGAIGARQNQVWLEWNEKQVAAGHKSAGGYAVRIDAGGILRSIPNAARTGIAINVLLLNEHHGGNVPAAAEEKEENEAEASWLYIVTRQQHAVNLARNYLMSIENDTFRVCRHAGFVFVCAVNNNGGSSDNVADWRAARSHQASLYGDANVSVDVLPEKSGPMLPLLDCDPWADQPYQYRPAQVPDETLSTIAMLLRSSNEAPAQSDLAALHLTA